MTETKTIMHWGLNHGRTTAQAKAMMERIIEWGHPNIELHAHSEELLVYKDALKEILETPEIDWHEAQEIAKEALAFDTGSKPAIKDE